MKANDGAKRNASLEQGVQVSMATQRAATTTRHRHTERLRGDTYQPQYSPRTTKTNYDIIIMIDIVLLFADGYFFVP